MTTQYWPYEDQGRAIQAEKMLTEGPLEGMLLGLRAAKRKPVRLEGSRLGRGVQSAAERSGSGLCRFCQLGFGLVF